METDVIGAAFAAPGRFWRGNLHTHSNRSDGALTPDEVCRRYSAEGYDFIALTDHFVGRYDYPITDTTALRTNRFTTLLGAELHSGALANGEIWHILAVGLPADFPSSNSPDFQPTERQETGAQLAARAVEAGAFVAIAHPQWSGITLEDALGLESAHAVEIYNHGCHIGCDRGDGFSIADLLLTAGRRISLVATDDAHFTEPDHFGGWVMVKAEENSPEELLFALKSGRYYSSQGPELRGIHLNSDAIEVECSAAVTVIVQGRGAAAVARHGQSMTQARITFDKRCAESSWLRVTVIDAAGRRAWSNPFWR